MSDKLVYMQDVMAAAAHIAERQQLLDMFAAHALTGQLASMNPGFVSTNVAIKTATCAYDMAAAMMAERDRRLNMQAREEGQ